MFGKLSAVTTTTRPPDPLSARAKRRAAGLADRAPNRSKGRFQQKCRRRWPRCAGRSARALNPRSTIAAGRPGGGRHRCRAAALLATIPKDYKRWNAKRNRAGDGQVIEEFTSRSNPGSRRKTEKWNRKTACTRKKRWQQPSARSKKRKQTRPSI